MMENSKKDSFITSPNLCISATKAPRLPNKNKKTIVLKINNELEDSLDADDHLANLIPQQNAVKKETEFYL